MTPEPYSGVLDIPCYMFDRNELLRPGAFMDIAQELAAKGAAQFNVTDPDLKKYGFVWIVVRMKISFAAFPHRGYRVAGRTWHRGLDGFSFIRDYELLSEGGERLIGATSTWIIMDWDNRAIVRESALEGIIPSGAQSVEKAAGSNAIKIIVPGNVEFELVRTMRASYSCVDYNGHLNNARYVDWVFDCLPEGVVYGGRPESLEINFNSEVLPGSEVDIFVGTADGKTFYVEGRSGGVRNFICMVNY